MVSRITTRGAAEVHCRVGKLVVGDLRLLKEPGASAISVTAEQWVRKRLLRPT